MPTLATASAVEAYLVEHGLIGTKTGEARSGIDGSGVDVTPFPGGVSNHVWRIDTGSESLVLKQPLKRLATKEEWISGTGRLDVEVDALRTLATWIPANVPDVRFHDPENKICLMTCAPDGALSWKEQMMAGSFNTDTAHGVGVLLRTIHNKSRSAPDKIRQKFDNLTFFQELRIDPFHHFVALKHPDLASPIGGLIEELTEHRSTFVHGDYSPKNILVDDSGGLTLIDLEVAHWGNPVFDVAYCLGHLMLKGWHLRQAADAAASIEAYLEGYGAFPNRLLPHLGLMLLARVDGKSTVEYLSDPDLIETVRSTGRSMLLGNAPRAPLQKILNAITD